VRRVVVVATAPATAARLAQHLGGAAPVAFDDPAALAAPEDVVVLHGPAGDDPAGVTRLAEVVRRLGDDRPGAAAPGRARGARHQLANHLAGIITALVVLERDLASAAASAETLQAARAQTSDILRVVREALALARPPAK
jgi:hypothetical protein